MVNIIKENYIIIIFKLIFEGEYKDGKKYKGKLYNYFGELIFEGEYKDGKKYKGKEYNRHGKLIFEGEYKDGKKYKGKEYDYNGKFIFDGEYKDNEYYEGIFNNIDNPGEICGKLIKGNSNNIEYKKKVYIDITLIFKGDYKNGKKCNGILELYDEFNKLIFEDRYENGINKFNENNKNNIMMLQLPNQSKEEIIKGREYDKHGLIIFEGEFKNGQRYKGLSKEETRFGKKIFCGEYKDGNKFYGCEYYIDYFFREKKNIIFEGEFKNNKKYKGKEYTKLGELIYEGDYNNDKRWNGKGYNNISEFYFVNGKIEGNLYVYDYINHELFEGEYKQGEKYNGILRTYFDDINDILKREVAVKNGKIEGKGKEYYGNQRLKYQGTFKNGKYDGNGILYYEFFGYIKYIGEFKDGMKEGFGKEYDKQGNLIYEGKYLKDKKV